MSGPYELRLEARVGDEPTEFQFTTRDGVHSKDAFRPSELALLDTLWNADIDSLLSVEANYGVVGTILAERADVTMIESSARSTRLCERNAAKNHASVDVRCCVGPREVAQSFDVVAYAPKPYTPLAVGKQRVVSALATLAPDGRLFVAGTTETGISRYERLLDAECETSERVATPNNVRVVSSTPPAEYEPPSFVEPQRIRATVDDTRLTLVSVPGLFSATGLDRGTRLLLESVSPQTGARVLDLCCGYGSIGTYVAKTADCEVWLTDDDAVATACAACSLDASAVEGTVVTGDATRAVADRTFDRVLCNPPTHAGDGVLHDLFEGARGVLADDGRLTVVHHRELDLSPHFDGFDVAGKRVGSEHVVLDLVP